MHRRDFLKFLLTTPVALQLDVEKLLWIPGEKTIFLPSFTESQIIAIELERILPHIRTLFDRDDTFYAVLSDRKIEAISNRPFKIPFEIKPGELK